MINKRELAKIIANKQGITQNEALDKINVIFDEIEEQLKKNNDVNIVGFGAFQSIMRKKRIATNPQTAEQFELPERRVFKFSAGKHLKNMYKDKK
jgi:DNA-binding protein HU-beta